MNKIKIHKINYPKKKKINKKIIKNQVIINKNRS